MRQCQCGSSVPSQPRAPLIIEPGKLYKTRDGRKVRIYATDGGKYPVHGATQCPSGWQTDSWTLDGFAFYGRNNSADIIAEWTEPHPLADAKPGDVVWVRDEETQGWAISLFVRLDLNASNTVIASGYQDLTREFGWRFGKPYIPGEQP